MSPFQPNSPAMPHTPADNYQVKLFFNMIKFFQKKEFSFEENL